MRVLTGIVCGILWITFLAFLVSKGNQIDSNMTVLTTAIVVAGGMAGGD